jgi:hypothetical protein
MQRLLLGGPVAVRVHVGVLGETPAEAALGVQCLVEEIAPGMHSLKMILKRDC